MADKLDWKDKLNITVESGLQLVPVVGGALSTAYFSTKQEKRLKRLETFYEDFSNQVRQRQLPLAPMNLHDEEALIALIEDLNDKVERECIELKKAYFKNFLYCTLASPSTFENFDERRYFLDALANMTYLESEILLTLKQEDEPVKVEGISSKNTDQHAIIGAIGRLKLHGFLRTLPLNIVTAVEDKALLEWVTPSEFGHRFINYCLE